MIQTLILPMSRDKLKIKQNGIKMVNMVAMIAAVVRVQFAVAFIRPVSSFRLYTRL